LLDSLFEHPARGSPVVADVRAVEVFVPKSFFSSLLGLLGKFRRIKAEAGDELTAGGLSCRQSYIALLEVAAGSHE